MVGGPHWCMLDDELQPLVLDDWECTSAYVHVSYAPANPYCAADLEAASRAISAADAQRELAARVLLRDEHAPSHPLPGTFTFRSPGYRVDLRLYPHDGNKKNLWAEVMRVPVV